MRRLYIKNIGPITEAIIDFKRYNFFIGAQSCGKSTIAKIYSMCSWIEKEACTTLNEYAIKSVSDFKTRLIEFHKMDNYLKSDSEILFETDAVRIEYKEPQHFKVLFKENNDYHREKICYIPAERNIVSLFELSNLSLKNDNLKSFIFDWYNARKNYNSENKSNILNLGINYYYDQTSIDNKDFVEYSNGETYHMSLGSASSGLQSVIPLQILLNYYTSTYFDTYGGIGSFNENEKANQLQQYLYDTIVLKELYPEFQQQDKSYYSGEVSKRMIAGDNVVIQLYQKFLQTAKRLIYPHCSRFIIEEPEENLYPNTQMDLLDYMVNCCQDESRKHELTITTHSPYILNQLNLMFKRFDVGDKNTMGLNYEDVTAFAIEDGRVKDLKVQNAHLVDPEYLSEPIDRIYQQYDMYQ